MSERQFYYTIDGTDVAGPIMADALWECVNTGQLPSEVQVCEAGTQDWLLFSSLPDSVFSVRVLAQAARQTNNLGQAEQLHLQATHRLIDCQSHVQVYGHRNAQIEQTARNGLEFIDAALRLFPDNPNYLNTKALLLSDGLDQKEPALTLLQQAAKIAPNDIQIQQNIRGLQASGCLVILGIGAAFLTPAVYIVARLCVA